MAFRQYYYNQQFRKATIIFANIFAGLRVHTGQDGCGDVLEVEVPVRYGSTDRVASAIAAGNTQNNLHTLPMISVFMTEAGINVDRQKGIGSVSRRTYMPQGGVFPDDVKVIESIMPVPYDLAFEVSVYASNTDQAFQIIEQAGLVFDPDLQVQLNDAVFDWAKMAWVKMDGSWRNETNYPVGTDRQILVWSNTFRFETWLSLPMNIRSDIVKQIQINISDMGSGSSSLAEFDADGNLIPFDGGSVLMQMELTDASSTSGLQSQDFVNVVDNNGNAIQG